MMTPRDHTVRPKKSIRSKISSYIVIGFVAILAIIAYQIVSLLLDQNPQFLYYMNDPLSVYRDDSFLVFFDCHVGVHLCSIRTDGSDFVEHDVETSFLSTPKANSNSKIVFGCLAKGSHGGYSNYEICAMNTDGSEFLQLTNNQFKDKSPDVNDDGLVVFQCSTEIDAEPLQICLINIDGSGLRVLDQVNERAEYPQFASDDTIVFKCLRHPVSDLCAVKQDGTGLRPVGEVILDPGYGFDINKQNVIVARCRDSNDFEICSLPLDGSYLRIGGLPYNIFTEPKINNRGVYAYICEYQVNDICLIDPSQTYPPDKYGRISITKNSPDFSPEDALSINDAGIIAFSCHYKRYTSICLIRQDGSDLVALTLGHGYMNPSTPVILNH